MRKRGDVFVSGKQAYICAASPTPHKTDHTLSDLASTKIVDILEASHTRRAVRRSCVTLETHRVTTPLLLI